MRNLYVLVDCPLETSDKKWISERLYVDGFHTICKGVPERLSQLQRDGRIIREHYLQMRQIISVLKDSSKSDIIVVWYSVTGVLLNFFSILFGGRNIIIMNWMISKRNKQSRDFLDFIYSKLTKFAFRSPRCRILVNLKSAVEKLNEEYDLNGGIQRFYYQPDVYDDSVPFIQPRPDVEIDKRYLFTGGMANRDWALLSRIAEALPDYKFICVAMKEDFNSKVACIPGNMEVQFNLSPQDYYSLLDDSYAMLLPLLNIDSVGGLINVLKAWQMGKPCYVSRTSFIEPYYPNADSRYLMGPVVEEWVNKIKELMSLSNEEYCDNVKRMQSYIMMNFSPNSAISLIQDVVLSFNQ